MDLWLFIRSKDPKIQRSICFLKLKNEKKTQNNTLYNDKVLFCATMNINESYNSENKKVSKETKRWRFVIDLPNEEMKNELLDYARQKKLTQKQLTEEIFLDYVLSESLKNNDKHTQEILDNMRSQLSSKKEFSLTDNEKLKIKKLVILSYNMAKEKGDLELNKYKKYIEEYIKDLENFSGDGNYNTNT